MNDKGKPQGALSARTCVVHGPSGSGKTHHAADIARALGCASVVDGWSEGSDVSSGALHLTQDRPPYNGVRDDVVVLSIDAALSAAFSLGAI